MNDQNGFKNCMHVLTKKKTNQQKNIIQAKI